MLEIYEMKKILLQKFKEENCSFGYSDITIKKVKNNYHISIKDYDNIVFRMMFEIDNYFGFCVYINENYCNDVSNIIFIDSKEDYDIKTALIHLGYHIANTF